MRIYLDNCCFNRPFDDQSSLTIRLETEAKLDIQDKIREGLYSLGWSYILDYENSANPFLDRKIEIQGWEKIAEYYAKETPEILEEMKSLVSKLDLKPLDALHIACAIALQCNYFLTVDKGILKKAALIKTILIMNPIDFIIEREVIQ